MNATTAARLKLLAVFLLFFGPLAGAYILYYGFSYGSAATNGGVLVDPAQPLPAVRLRDRHGKSLASGRLFARNWTILQVSPDNCGQACRNSIDKTRQIRALLHRRAARVQRVLLTRNNAALPHFDAQPDLSVYQADIAPLMRVFRKRSASTAGTVYLVDPLGNWMLYYPPTDDGDALFKDLKHLLKLSHIG